MMNMPDLRLPRLVVLALPFLLATFLALSLPAHCLGSHPRALAANCSLAINCSQCKVRPTAGATG